MTKANPSPPPAPAPVSWKLNVVSNPADKQRLWKYQAPPTRLASAGVSRSRPPVTVASPCSASSDAELNCARSNTGVWPGLEGDSASQSRHNPDIRMVLMRTGSRISDDHGPSRIRPYDRN